MEWIETLKLTDEEKKQLKQNIKYWDKDRIQKAQAKLTEKNAKQIEKQLRKYYADTAKEVMDDFEATYLKVLEAVGEDKQPTPADLYKLDKYWKAQAQMRHKLQDLGEKTVSTLTKIFEIDFFDVYYSMAFDGGRDFNTLDSSIVTQMINQIWCADGKSWSQRIWSNTELLAETLNDQLIHTVVAGKKTTDLKNLLQARFDVSYSRADAVVRTELAHIQTQAATKRYEDAGVKQVQIWADKDERQCEICGKLHKQILPIGASVPVPAHPRCRCCVLPVLD